MTLSQNIFLKGIINALLTGTQVMLMLFFILKGDWFCVVPAVFVILSIKDIKQMYEELK